MMVCMSRESTELRKKALALSATERAKLAGSLTKSLDEVEDESVEKAWDAEIARRIEDLDSGRVKLISRDEFLRRLRLAITTP
jgi:putative addiction module component (TIGR02574 family)